MELTRKKKKQIREAIEKYIEENVLLCVCCQLPLYEKHEIRAMICDDCIAEIEDQQ